MSPLCGIIPPLITPLLDDQRLDPFHLEKLLDYVLAGGVHGLFLFGTTGEGPSLSREIKQEMLQRACQFVHGRIPILVNVSHTSLAETQLLAGYAADVGAAALVITAPYYFPIEQEDLWLYLQKLVKLLPLPFYLYNMPSHTRIGFALDTIRRAIDLPQIIGIKDSSGERGFLHQLITLGQKRADWSVLVGPEELFVEALQNRAQGGVLGGGNLYPRLLVDLFEAISKHDNARLPQLMDRLTWFHQHVYHVCPGPSGWLIGLKTFLSFQGLCREVFAEPLHQAHTVFHAQLEENWERLRLEGEY